MNSVMQSLDQEQSPVGQGWMSNLYSLCNEAIWIQEQQRGRTFWLNKENYWLNGVVSVWTVGTFNNGGGGVGGGGG